MAPSNFMFETARCDGSRVKTDIMISGEEWGSKLRDAIAKGAEVWSEGELLLKFDGRSDFPKASDVPNGENLSKLDVVSEGELAITNDVGELVLKYQEVAFTPHRRFVEMFGFDYEGDTQYLGNLFLDGKKLKPAKDDGYGLYGIESWRRAYFWENGSDYDDEMLTYKGTKGFNATPIVKLAGAGKEYTFPEVRESQGSVHFTFHGPTKWYGDVCYDQTNFWLMVNFDKKTYATVMHTGPYKIDPDDPYGS